MTSLISLRRTGAVLALCAFPLWAAATPVTSASTASDVPAASQIPYSAAGDVQADEVPPELAGLLLSQPLPGAEISSGYGWRVHPILKRRRFHEGVDFRAPRGTPIQAAADGVVEEVSKRGHYGLYLRIRHSDRVQTAYAHMAQFAEGLRAGDFVHRGQVIATVGTSGWATGPHLYYEVIVDGNRIDPLATMVRTNLRFNVREIPEGHGNSVTGKKHKSRGSKTTHRS